MQSLLTLIISWHEMASLHCNTNTEELPPSPQIKEDWGKQWCPVVYHNTLNADAGSRATEL